MIKIMQYSSEYLFSKRPHLVDYLADNLNNLVETDGEVDSGMLTNIESERNFTAFIAWERGVPIGWANLTFRSWDDHVQINLYVHPARRRKGIGVKLLGKITKWAKANNRTIVCQPWNPAGAEFYKKAGIMTSVSWADFDEHDRRMAYDNRYVFRSPNY